MSGKLLSSLYFLVGALNIIPIIGVMGADRLEALYGVSLTDAAALLMMQHRAVLLAIVGGLLVVASFKRALRPAAAICGFISMLSFMMLYWAGSSGGHSGDISSLAGIYQADAAGVAILTAACIWGFVQRKRESR